MGAPEQGFDSNIPQNSPDAIPSDDDGFNLDDNSPSDKPFDDEPFDAGVEADEDEDPKKFIQQLSGKLGQSLRKYTKEDGGIDFELEKFAINSLLSATHTSQMDDSDQKDIIDKVKSSGNHDDEPIDDEPIGDEAIDDEPIGDEPMDGDIEESVMDGGENPREAMYVEYLKPYADETPFIVHTPDGKKKFEYCWARYPDGKKDIAVYSQSGDITYGYKWFRKYFLNINENIRDEKKAEHARDAESHTEFNGDERSACCNGKFVHGDICSKCGEHSGPNTEDKLGENLKKSEKYSIFEEKLKLIVMEGLQNSLDIESIIDEVLGTDPTPEVKPDETITKPGTVEPDRKTRRERIWSPKPGITPDPKGMKDESR